MPKNELEKLTELLSRHSLIQRQTEQPPSLAPNLPGITVPSSRLESEAPGQSTDAAVAELGRISYELTRAMLPDRPTGTSSAKPSETTSASSTASSVAGTVLSTMGMVTGVGPLVTGLLKLFGSGEPEPQPALPTFTMPRSVNLEAGLLADGGFTALSYSQNGLPRASAERPTSSQQTQPIQIHVQAMDSRSFMDHSEEIARAVREAMLHSHSLNDVVSEL